MSLLQRIVRYLFGPPNDEMYVEGWTHALNAIAEGPDAIRRLQNQLDGDFVFGSTDAFTKGARDALKEWLQ